MSDMAPTLMYRSGADDRLATSRIMMADDEEIMMDLVKVFLEEEGYEDFIQVSQPVRVLEVLRQDRPDVLLLDLVMPEISGFEILAEMRSDERLQHLPVIVLTASGDADTKLKALELGASDFLSKPVDPSELKLRLRNTLEAKAYQDQLAYYDGVTGLPNRRLFVEELDWALKLATRQQHTLSVAQVALASYRDLDNTLGPEAGNEILVTAAGRIQAVIRESDKFASGDDELLDTTLSYVSAGQFSIMLPGLQAEDSALTVARRVADALAEPMTIQGNEVVLDSNVGISVFPHDADDAEELLRCAGGALQQAAVKGAGSHQFYSSEIDERSRERLAMENRLRHALGNHELELHYQPKVDVRTDRIHGVEALLRWHSPELGPVSPAVFIPVAEESGIIRDIGCWVVADACERARIWRDAGLRELQTAVNVSALQLKGDEFFEHLQQCLKEFSIPAAQLTVELTESQIMDDVDEATRLMRELRRLGCRISVDDFGTGYSSLSYLKQFPVDELKIDQSFIANVHADPRDAAIVSAVISMSVGLGLSVVCEGVEETATLDFLKTTECDLWQGYLCSVPVNGDDFQRLYLEGAGVSFHL